MRATRPPGARTTDRYLHCSSVPRPPAVPAYRSDGPVKDDPIGALAKSARTDRETPPPRRHLLSKAFGRWIPPFAGGDPAPSTPLECTMPGCCGSRLVLSYDSTEGGPRIPSGAGAAACEGWPDLLQRPIGGEKSRNRSEDQV